MAIDTDAYDEPVIYWLNQIEAAQKDREQWDERGKAVLERYIDKREAKGAEAHRMNVLWSNVETIKPALYARTPNPKVQRRYRDKDAVGKWAAIVIERSLGYTFDAYDVDHCIRNSVHDYLLPGRGQVWVSYEAEIKPGPDGAEQLAWEYCKAEHVNWKDFLHNPARTWDEVWWVAKRAYLSKDEVLDHPLFGKKIADKLTFAEQKNEGDRDASSQGRIKKAAIWQIWCKPKGKVHYVSKNCSEMLAETDPPIAFENFFPCPRPLTTTVTTDSIIPTPDFCQYQNQADEIDRLTQRIDMLTKALRVVGVYDASQQNLAILLEDHDQNKMVPVDTWVQLAQQGGLNGSVDFLPLKEVIEALNQCYLSRDQAKASMYEITGMSDIVRGASDAGETATAQQIKSQWGSLRIRDRQAEVQRFVRDIVRLKSEIIAEHFQLETLRAMTNCPILTQEEKQALEQRKRISGIVQQVQQIPPEQVQAFIQQNPQVMMLVQQVQANPQMAAQLTLDEEQKLREPTWEEVYALLKDQRLRSFRIDIETDSTINADEVAEKQQRIEFVTAATSFVQAWGPILMQEPKMAPLAGALLTFATRAFKQSDSVESEIEAMVDGMNQQAMLPQPEPQEDPKIALEREKMDREDAFRREELQAKGQIELQKQQSEVAVAQASQPRSPSSTEMIPALAPLYEIIQGGLAALAQGNQEMQAAVAQAMQATAQAQQASAEAQTSMAQAIAESQTRVEQSIAQMLTLAAAPKQITVTRDQSGRISGGSAQSRMN